MLSVAVVPVSLEIEAEIEMIVWDVCMAGVVTWDNCSSGRLLWDVVETASRKFAQVKASVEDETVVGSEHEILEVEVAVVVVADVACLMECWTWVGQ
jgi:hypothetical protein